MRVTRLALPGVLRLEPEIFRDERGLFYESYNERRFAEIAGAPVVFVQDNHSRSARNVLRGLHYQVKQPQGKLLRVIAGEIFDVAVDVRRHSPTLGRWVGETLTAQSGSSLWLPPGFAHGFLVLSEHAEVLYKATAYWAPEHERCIAWNDPHLNICWPLASAPVVSAKDARGTPFPEAEYIDDALATVKAPGAASP